MKWERKNSKSHRFPRVSNRLVFFHKPLRIIYFLKYIPLEKLAPKNGETVKLLNEDSLGPLKNPSERALRLSSGSEAEVEVIEVSPGSGKGEESRPLSPEYNQHVKNSVRKRPLYVQL